MPQNETTQFSAAEIEDLIQDLLRSTEHCPARDVIAAGLIANLRDEIANLLDEIASLKADIEGAAHNRFYDQRDGYFEGLRDAKNNDW